MGKNLSKQKSWVKDEKFLKENYGKMSGKEMAAKLGRTESSIYSKINELGLSKNNMSMDEILDEPEAPEAPEAATKAPKEEPEAIAPEKATIENNSLVPFIINLETAYKEKSEENDRLKDFISALEKSFEVLRAKYLS